MTKEWETSQHHKDYFQARVDEGMAASQIHLLRLNIRIDFSRRGSILSQQVYDLHITDRFVVEALYLFCIMWAALKPSACLNCRAIALERFQIDRNNF